MPKCQVILCNPIKRKPCSIICIPASKPLSQFERDPLADVLLDSLEARWSSSRQAIRVDYEQRVPIARHFEVFMTPLWRSRRKMPMHRGGGRSTILIIMRDLTQQEKVERMRADFVAHASHELRTPLAAVLGFIETLQGAAKERRGSARADFSILCGSQANAHDPPDRGSPVVESHRTECPHQAGNDSIVDLEQAVRHVLEEYLAPLDRRRRKPP